MKLPKLTNAQKYIIMALIHLIAGLLIGFGPLIIIVGSFYMVCFFCWLCCPDMFEGTIWDKFFP